MLACGVCHSDIHIHDGYFDLGGGAKLPTPLMEPLTMGHEIYGELVETGEDVHGVEIGKKYGEEYEEYLNQKLKGRYDLIWIRNPLDSKVALQWNKMFLMNLDYPDPIVVMDIDILLENNFHELFEYPIQKGEFLSIPAWWNERAGYLSNGGFFKYYPKDCKYIFDEFINNSKHWQSHYIKEVCAIGIDDELAGKELIVFIVSNTKTRVTNVVENLIFNNFGSFALPKKIILLSELPKTRSGKILRRVLRDLYLNPNTKKIGDLSTILNKNVIVEIKKKLIRINKN